MLALCTQAVSYCISNGGDALTDEGTVLKELDLYFYCYLVNKYHTNIHLWVSPPPEMYRMKPKVYLLWRLELVRVQLSYIWNTIGTFDPNFLTVAVTSWRKHLGLKLAGHAKWDQDGALENVSEVLTVGFRGGQSLKVGGCDEVITDKALVTTQNSSSHRLPAFDRQSLSLQSLGWYFSFDTTLWYPDQEYKSDLVMNTKTYPEVYFGYIK